MAKDSKTPKVIPGKPVTKTNPAPAKPAPATSRAVATTQTTIVPFNRKPLLKPTGGGSCNYLQFMTTRATKYKDTLKALGLKATDVEDDFPVIQTPDGPVYPRDFRFVLTSQFFQHFSIFNEKYELQESVMDVEERPGDEYTEVVDSLIIAFTDKGPLPVCATFKGTKVGCFHDVHSAVVDSKDDTDAQGVWIGHVGEIQLKPIISKRTKRELVIGSANTFPTTEEQVAEIEAAFNDKDFLAALQACVRWMKDRYAEVERKNIN